ncbi:MAG TPA: thiamine phosphate synthase [Lacipirellulaceae bacterium]|jgi:thiamine-phosphate pyrophosphorylase|nr:thiamine phosphate synthase [Lacipirellulaceae bacterium]
MSQIPVLRILDASLNRATEGLRVIEDYARFVLDDSFLTHMAKTLRHDLAASSAAISSTDRHAARDTQHDVGTQISTEAESERLGTWDVCAASFKRAEQSLRSLEEYGKIVSGEFAGRCESLRYRLYTLEKAFDVNRVSRDALDGVTLCVLLNGSSSAAEFEAIVKSLVAAHVGMIQLRDKNLDDRDLVDRGRRLVSLTRRPALHDRQRPAMPGVSVTHQTATVAIINDRPDIAAIVDADGVHVGQEDMSVKDARAIVGPRMLVGVSTHNIDQARAAVLDGANYLGAGPTFTSTTKSFNQFAGLEYLREVATEIQLPTFAIGGITAKNVDDVLATGITRVAVSGAITSAPDRASATTELLSILNRRSPLAV